MSKEAKKNEKRNKRLAHREKTNKRWAKKGDKLNVKSLMQEVQEMQRSLPSWKRNRKTL